MNDALQLTFGILSAAACVGILALGIAWTRWTLIALALAASASTGLYIAVALGAPPTDTIIVLSGLTRTLTLLACVAAAIGSQGTSERLHTLMARHGIGDPGEKRWDA
jgi:hypothetical protein